MSVMLGVNKSIYYRIESVVTITTTVFVLKPPSIYYRIERDILSL